MRALVLRDYWDLSVEQRPDPVPDPDETLLRIVATGICGSDVHGFTGENGRRFPGQVMGHETVGVVEEPGRTGGPAIGSVVTVNPVLSCGRCPACHDGREQACPDKQVVGVDAGLSSAFAELMAVPTRNVVPLPEAMPVEHGALVEPLAVGYHAVRRGGCRPDDAVLVLGGGPIGQACILASLRLGAGRVVVSEPDPHRRQLCAALGAHAIDPDDGAFSQRAAQALGAMPTLVVDAVGSTASIRSGLAAVAPGGRVVLVGMAAPGIELPAYAVSTQERTLIGSFCYSASEFRQTAEWVGSGPGGLARLIDDRVDLQAAPGMFASLARGETSASKILVFPQHPPAGG